MNTFNTTKKLFHAIVVIGMTTSLGCSGDTTSSTDASTDGMAGNDTSTKDTGAADVQQSNDAGNDGDAFTGWLGC